MATATTLTLDQLRVRVLDFLTACDLMDGRGYDLSETHSPFLLRALATQNTVALARELEEALAEASRAVNDAHWFSQESADKARELTARLSA